MFGRRKANLKEGIAGASELAVQLAQDKRFRKRLLSALEHGAEASNRARREAQGGVARLARDQRLLRELGKASRDLSRAYERVERKRSRKLRKVLGLALVAVLAGVPQVRSGPSVQR